MKLDTRAKYRWTADFYMPVQNQDDQYEYQMQRTISFDLASGMAQTYVYSVEPIDWGGMLLNVTNSLGERPYFVGGKNTEMYVTASSPVFDIYGRLTGYQQVIMRTRPTGWEGAVVAATTADGSVGV